MKLAFAAACLALAACNPYLTQQSVAPPGRAARLDRVDGFWGLMHYKLEISEGIALAVTCTQGGPCATAQMVSDDPAVVEVRPASLTALEPVGFDTQTPSSAFVIVGKAPGTTKLHVRTASGSRDVAVTVIAPPGPPNEQTAAK